MTNNDQHIFGVKCHACGRVSHFDRRYVCGDHHVVLRSQITSFTEDEVEPYVEEPAFEQGQKLSRLSLDCDHCDEQIIVVADCGGYL
jgi:hypothetical protein